MSKKRKGNNAGPVVMPRLAANKSGRVEDRAAANLKQHAVQRVVEFPNRPKANEVVSDSIIFDVGGDRFAIQWTAEIQRLPPAGPLHWSAGSDGNRTGRPARRRVKSTQ